MSIRVMSMVWEKSKQKGNGLILLLALADFSNDEGQCFPSVDTLANKTRMSRRNVQTLARQLVDDGEITIKENGGRNGSNLYEIQGVQNLHPCKPAPEIRSAPGAESRPNPAPKPSGTVIEPSGTSSGAGAPPPGEGEKPKAPKDDRHQAFMDSWAESYEQQFHRGYVFNGGRDGKALKALLSSTKQTAGELMAVATRAWARKGKLFFRCEKAVTIAAFCGSFVEIVHELEQVRPGDVRNGNHAPKPAAEDPDVAALYKAPGEK